MNSGSIGAITETAALWRASSRKVAVWSIPDVTNLCFKSGIACDAVCEMFASTSSAAITTANIAVILSSVNFCISYRMNNDEPVRIIAFAIRSGCGSRSRILIPGDPFVPKEFVCKARLRALTMLRHAQSRRSYGVKFWSMKTNVEGSASARIRFPTSKWIFNSAKSSVSNVRGLQSAPILGTNYRTSESQASVACSLVDTCTQAVQRSPRICCSPSWQHQQLPQAMFRTFDEQVYLESV